MMTNTTNSTSGSLLNCTATMHILGGGGGGGSGGRGVRGGWVTGLRDVGYPIKCWGRGWPGNGLASH